MVQLTIDGQQLEVPEGITVLSAARRNGIKIPTLCAHRSLTPYGGCRLCVVEIEGMRNVQTSCTMPVSNGMVIHTNTEKIKESRKFVLSMLFSERNHFCMYCQVSGGECELQNAALDEGMDHWPLQPNWTNYAVDASHPYYVLDHNRCILCRRCVRACAEMTGNFTLATEERGASTMIIADYGVPLGESSCVSCGNCVQQCPTGALIDRQSAYRGLEPKADHIKSTCVGCSVGCAVDLIVHDNQLLRVEGDYDAPLNGGMMCELGRFKPIFDKQTRIRTPMIRKDGALKAATWDEAVAVIIENIKDKKVAALASTRLPAEALAIFKEFFADDLGGKMVTSIEENFPTQGLNEVRKSGLEGTLKDLRESDCVITIGADLFKSHMVAGFFVKRNLPNGTKLIVIDAGDNQMAERADIFVQPKQGSDYEFLQGLAGNISPEEVNKSTYVNIKSLEDSINLIKAAKKPVFVYGKGLSQQDGKVAEKSPLQALIGLAKSVNGKIFSPKGKANSLAAAAYKLDKPFDTHGFETVYLALGDDDPSNYLIQRLEKVPFLVVQASHDSKLMAKASVVLPVSTWVEQGGHYVNLDGLLQTTQPGTKAPEGVLSNEEALQIVAKASGFALKANWKSELKDYIRE
ncbi:MAG: molybdopterin-dependent oxidoreductase [Chloroflexota bacterium]